MTRPKPSYSTTNLQTPICTAQISCDGVNLVGAARERGYCNPCGEAAKKRGRVIPPRGENSALPESLRKKGDE